MRRTSATRPRAGERGFALMFVFLMAASIAIFFYLELPRAAFESQRVKEGMLIERGEQYSRAIKLYVRKWNKYPANLEELENTNSVRYLRRRYRDPLTGKEEWRLIHVGPGGVFTDSLVYDRAKNVTDSGSDKDKPKDGKAEAAASTFITSGPAFGSTDPLPDTKAAAGSRFRKKRAWENAKKQGSEDTSNAATADASQTTDTTLSSGAPAPEPAALPSGVNPQTGGMLGSPFPAVSGVTPTASGMTPGASNQALDMIRRILTTPRQGGLMGVQTGGMQIGGGLAGVASKAEEEGIKVYADRTAYNEWEFVYDVRKDAAKATAAMTGSQGNTGMGTGMGTGIGTGMGTGIGTGIGIGTGTGMGVTPGANSPFGGVSGQGR